MNAVAAVRTSPARSTPAGAAENFFLLLLLICPLAASPPMQAHIIDLPGAKLAYLVAISFALAFLSKGARLLAALDRLERGAIRFFAIYIFVFAVAFARSVPNIPRFHAIAQDMYPSGTAEFVFSLFLLPLIIAATFIYVLKFVRSEESISRLLRTIAIAMFFLSCVVLVAIASRPEVYEDRNRFAMATLTGDVLGMHYNGVGMFYIATGPILLYLALKRGSFWTLNYFFALFAVALLESRAALFIFVTMSVGTLIALGRARTLVAAAPPIALVAAFALGPLLLQLLTMGFTEHSGVSLALLLSDRGNQIWLPLILEWWSDPQRFWFGAGENGILTSYMLVSGTILAVAHPHNAYLDFFLDNGIVLLAALLVAIAFFLRWSWRLGRQIKSGLYWVLYLCVASYLIAGFIGHEFYPTWESMFMFPVIALMINVARLELSTGITPQQARAGRTQSIESLDATA